MAILEQIRAFSYRIALSTDRFLKIMFIIVMIRTWLIYGDESFRLLTDSEFEWLVQFRDEFIMRFDS